jgi:hypothetical protein
LGQGGGKISCLKAGFKNKMVFMSKKSKKQNVGIQKKTSGTNFGGEIDVNKRQGSYSEITILAVLILAVSVMVLCVHWPALSTGSLSSDDTQYLTENHLVQKPSWTSARRFLCEVLEPSTVRGYYQPLTMISLMIDYVQGGRSDNLRAFHRTSLCLHIFNTVLVVVLLYLLFGQLWAAAALGLLFGLHPMTVDTIAWVGERKTVLAAFFSLCSLTFYAGYARKGGWKLYLGTVLTYVLALMSKPTSTPLPVMMLVMDWRPLNRLSKRALVEKVPLFLIAAVSAGITIVSQGRTADMSMPSAHSATSLLLLICHNTIFYLWKIFWPLNLSCHYPFPQPFDFSNTILLGYVFGAFLLAVGLFFSLWRKWCALAGWLFFYIGILPTIQVIGFTNVVAANKFIYLPAVGLLISGMYFLGWLWNLRLSRRGRGLYQPAIVVVIILAAAAEMICTRQYLIHWRDTESLHRHMIRVTPDAPIPYNNLGEYYYRNGRLEEATKCWVKAAGLNPGYTDALNNLAWVLGTHNDANIRDGAKAVRLAERACELSGYNNASKLDTLAAAYAAQGEFDKAIDTANKALALALEREKKALADEIRKRLNLYNNREPYVEPRQRGKGR